MAGRPPNKKPARTIPGVSGMALLLALASCAPTSHDPLHSRTLPEEKRYEFLVTRGSDNSPVIRDAFIDGRVIRGMPREWVLELYGRPDGVLDSGWEYRDKGGNLLLGIIFDQDTVDSVVTVHRAGDKVAEHPKQGRQ